MEHWSEYSRFITALVVILNPFAAVPILLSLTQGYTLKERARVAVVTTVTVAVVLVISALAGEHLLKLLGTSLASFRVGGGIILLLMALSMLRAQADAVRTTTAERMAAEEKQSVAVVPLGLPLLAGPGAITTVIIQMHRSTTTFHPVVVITCILFVCSILWLVLRLAVPIGDKLGPIGPQYC